MGLNWTNKQDLVDTILAADVNALAAAIIALEKASVKVHASTHATGGGDVLTPASIGAASSSHTHTPASIGAQAARLTFTNKSIATSAWLSDSTYTDFPYRAAVACTGVTAAMFAEVVLSPADALSGNIAPVCQTYSGGVYLYAKAVPSAAVTIPTIIVWG